jgi:hypothetical protein
MNLGPRIVVTTFAAAVIGAAGLLAQDQSASYSARIVDFEQPRGSDPGLVQVRVTRWATDADRDLLTDALMKDGQDGLLDELSKLPPAGVIRTPGTAGYTFRYARRIPSPTGDETLLVIIGRPIGLAEFRGGWLTRDYPLTVVQMQFDSEGKGAGRILAAARVHASNVSQEIAFEHYSASPLVLQGVQRE